MSLKLKKHAERFPAWIFTILVVAVVLWLTLAPHPLGEEQIPLFPGADKLAHALMFGLLTVVALFDWSRKRAWRDATWPGAMLAAFLSAAFGVGVEYLQRAMQLGRGFETGDMIADAAGAFLLGIGWMILQHTRPSGPKVESGKLKVESDERKVESGKLKVESDERKVESGKLKVESENSDCSDKADCSEKKPAKKPRKLPKWLRILLKTLGWIVIVVLLIPVALYIPPVQTFVKNVACKVVKDKTGMDVTIDRFRLKFPLDISLQGVNVLEASGDTMVNAKEALVDVKLLPLLDLDVQVKRLRLLDGYYRMLSPDSSMTMKIRAGLLEVDDKSSVDIRKSHILLNKVLLKDGDISLDMDVWKKKPTPPDSVQPSTPFLIKVADLKVENIGFTMSMLPTIDRLSVGGQNLELHNAVIDLGTNEISADGLSLSDGSFSYITPTPEYIKTHPAPIDTISPPSAPMKIKAKDIRLDNISGLYGVKGARPAPGFDATYIQLSDVGVRLKDFYNEASTVILPIDSLAARERSGLRIVSGSGVFKIDSIGLNLTNIALRTPFSRISADAEIPFALMEMKPDAAMSVKADAAVGMADVTAFMPALGKYTSALPGRGPLRLNIDADGTLASLRIGRLDASFPDVLKLQAHGFADNALDFKRLRAALDIDGTLANPSPIEKIAGPLGFSLPPFRIKGTASASGQRYTADLGLTTSKGDIAAKGNVSLTAESYNADVQIHDIDVAHFVPSLGIGNVTASVTARGAGFNPSRPGAATEVDLAVASIVYKSHPLTDIDLHARLADGMYEVVGRSPNKGLDFDIDLSGNVAPDDYTAEGYVHLRDIDLQELGLTKDMCNGTADFYIDAKASPERWLYDAHLSLQQLDWNMPDRYIHLPAGVKADILAREGDVTCHVESQLTSIDFVSTTGLKNVVDAFTAAATEATTQIGKRELVMDSIQHKLPPFTLDVQASGRGLIQQLLSPSGMGVDTVYAHLRNDSLLRGNVGVLALNTGSLSLDTITLGLSQRGSLLDYKAHVGNRPGTLDEFAKVDLNGYLGSNRVSAFLRQHNLKGETGYRLGLTAALQDSTVSVHFTPLKATIAYLPWTLNDDNHIDLDISTFKIDANLEAKSAESSILVMTEPDGNGGNDLHLNLKDIHVQDFLKMSVFAPPITASVSSDLRLHYDEKSLTGKGTLGVTDFTYDKTQVGDIGAKFKAELNFEGDTEVLLAMDVADVQNALLFKGVMGKTEESSFDVKTMRAILRGFPLKVANPFLGEKTARLSGALNGDMAMSGNLAKPQLDGRIAFADAKVFIPMIGSELTLDTVPVTVDKSVVRFDNFDVWGVNRNSIALDGSVDAADFSDISFDLGLNGQNVQLVGNDKRAKSDLYGKLFVNLAASAKGPMKHFDVRADLDILGTTDVYYNIPASTETLVEESDNGVVTFVNLSDTTQVAKADSVPRQMAMRINANLNINPGTQVTVNLSNNGTDKVQLSPSGQLNFIMNYMGDMHLTGQLLTGNGFARYSIPVVGEKNFSFDPQSSIGFNGDIMNPVLKIKATDQIKANVANSSGNTRLVNFLLTLNATGTLSQPQVAFDLSTDDDMTLQNELQSMSADQRQQQAMNLLLTGQYSGMGTKTVSGPMTGSVYNFLAGQLNSWAAKNIRGVDLSFGVDQYDTSRDGQKATTTSYSYQVSKSLFNNRFKINVGGNYSTDATPDENLSQNLISDISFEYMLKQTQTTSMYVKLFRHSGYESILEGEVTETGVGFVMRRRLQSLRGLFHWGKKKQKILPGYVGDRQDSLPGGLPATPAPAPTDTTTPQTKEGGDK